MNGPINLPANLSGNGSIAYLGNQGTVNGLITTYSGNQVTLSGNNTSFTGQTILGFGAGAAGGLTIDSEARLGANPTTFTYNRLSMNRGTLTTTATMTLSNANRGILLDVNGGGFNVASGTTLTLGCQLFSPTIAGGATGGNLNKAGAGALIITTTNSAFNGMLYVDSDSSSANDGTVRLVNNLAMANAHSVHVRNSGTGTSTLLLDGSAANITLPAVYLNGRNNPTPAIESLSGTNTLAGGINTYGSGACAVQVDAGILNAGGTITTSDGGVGHDYFPRQRHGKLDRQHRQRQWHDEREQVWQRHVELWGQQHLQRFDHGESGARWLCSRCPQRRCCISPSTTRRAAATAQSSRTPAAAARR